MSALCVFIAGVFGVEPGLVTPETGPGQFPAWDSLGHIQLVAALEEKYGVQFSTDEILNLFSVADIARSIEEKGASVG